MYYYFYLEHAGQGEQRCSCLWQAIVTVEEDFGLKLKDRELAGERNRAKRKYVLTL